MSNIKQIFELLEKVRDEQIDIGKDVSAMKQHLKGINGCVQKHDEDIDKLKFRVAAGGGGLGAIMLILTILSSLGFI